MPLVLASIGLLSRGWALVGHAVLTAAVLRLVPPSATVPNPSAMTSGESRLVASAGAALGVLAVAPTIRVLPSFHVETRHYHVANLATWLHERTLWRLPFQNPGLFTATHPGNGELFGLWLALPTHGDHLMYLMNLGFGALVVLACALVARELGGKPAAGAVAALAVLTAPLVFRTQAHSLATDLAATATLIATVAALLSARRRGSGSMIALAGVALGLALGSKYTMLVPAALILVWAAVALRPRRRFWLLLPGLLLFAAPWFARNWIDTGNPIFPMEIRVGDVELAPGGQSPLERYDTTIAEHALRARGEALRRWGHLTWDLYGPVTILAVAGVAAAFRRSRPRGGRRATALLAIGCGLAYAITPYTGAGREGVAFLMGSNLRYALPAVMLGATVAAATLGRRAFAALALTSLGVGAYQIVRGSPLRPELELVPAVAVGALAAAIVVGWAVGARGWRTHHATLAAGGLAVALVGAWGFVLRVDRSMEPSHLQAALSHVRGAGTVLVLGVDDLRSVLGDRLERPLETLSDGGAADERPYDDPQELNEALEKQGNDVLVVRRGTASVPEGWTPPDTWQLVEETDQGAIYVRAAEPP